MKMNLMNTGAYCGRSFEEAEPKPAGPKVGETTVVEQWNGRRWVAVKLVWNGAAYVAPAATTSTDDNS